MEMGGSETTKTLTFGIFKSCHSASLFVCLFVCFSHSSLGCITNFDIIFLVMGCYWVSSVIKQNLYRQFLFSWIHSSRKVSLKFAMIMFLDFKQHWSSRGFHHSSNNDNYNNYINYHYIKYFIRIKPNY